MIAFLEVQAFTAYFKHEYFLLYVRNDSPASSRTRHQVWKAPTAILRLALRIGSSFFKFVNVVELYTGHVL